MGQKRAAFQKNINKVIREILKNNGLKEDPRDYINKISKGIKPLFNVLYRLINNFAVGEINEAFFLSNTQKELNVSEETAKNIFAEVKKEILPFLIILDEDEIEKENAAPAQSKNTEALPKRETEKIKTERQSIIKKPPVLSVEENEKFLNQGKKPVATRKASKEESRENNKLPKKPPRMEKPKPANESDPYRESIG